MIPVRAKECLETSHDEAKISNVGPDVFAGHVCCRKWAPRFVPPATTMTRFQYAAQGERNIRKSFTLTGAHKVLDVDNIFGSIDVIGGQGDQVQLVVNKTISAESKDRMDTAKEEVTLDITDQPDFLKLYVNGPFRCNCKDGHDSCGWHGDRGYRVKMDFQLQVPRNVEIKLKTVNSGQVRVQDVTGNFDVHNVNGGIDEKYCRFRLAKT